MSLQRWKFHIDQQNIRNQERRNLEENFNAEILRRHNAGEGKDEIVADMRISRELFNRVIRASRRVAY